MATFKWGGRSWAAGDKKAFSTWLARHGSSYGAWSSKHAGAAAAFGPTTLMGLAGQQAQQSIDPELQALQQEQARSDASSKQTIDNSRSIDSALASLLGTIAPNIQSTYSGAAGEIGSLAKGFGDKAVADSAAQGQDQASFLKEVAHAPDAQVAGVQAAGGGQNLGDVLYGTRGFIPASTLAREGAAQVAEAQRLPGYELRQGDINATLLTKQAMQQDQSYADDMAKLRAQLPGLTTQAYNNILSQQRAEEANQIQREYLMGSQRKTDATITGIDPATGLPTYTNQHNAATLADRKAARAAAARAKVLAAKAKAGAANKKSGGQREKDFAAARVAISDKVRGLETPLTKQERTQWILNHPGASIKDIPSNRHPDYVTLKTQLFNEYKGLLRYGTRSSKPVLKRRLNSMIDEILASFGIHPAAGPGGLPPATADRGPGGTGPH